MKNIINELAMSVACLLDDTDSIETKDLYHIQDLVTELENPKQPTTITQNQTTEHLRADLKRERQTVARLLFLLEEELSANGQTFASMETDILFKRWYWGESTTKHSEVFDRLRATYKPTA